MGGRNMKPMNNLFNYIGIFSLFLLFSCGSQQESTTNETVDPGIFDNLPEQLDLSEANSQGLLSIKKQVLQPDSAGVLANIPIQLPGYQKGIYYRPFSSHLASGNRMEALWFNSPADLSNYTLNKPREDDNMNLGAFLVLKKTNGNYLAVLPLVSKEVGNTIFVTDNGFQLQTATYGTASIDTETPLLAYAESESIYEAAHKAWALAKDTPMLEGQINWRSDKTFPEPFRYLGWCSWEHYKKKINEAIIVKSIKDIQQSDLPIRWVMVDDGYLDNEKGGLLSFGVEEEKFPNGWEPIVKLKDEKVKWMGIWRNFNGYMAGVSPSNTMTALQDDLEIGSSSYKKRPLMVTKPSQASSDAFYQLMTEDTRANGFDIIKVDFQSDNWRFNTGKANAIQAVHQNQKALEEQVKDKGLHLINCIAMQNFNVFNQSHSSIIRSSIDYKTFVDRVDVTLVQNFTNAFWLGHLFWTDQDMFHTSYKETARLMAIARAVSGGPIYLSDETKNIDDTYLRPLMYEDGRILGTLAPGVPLPETMMQDPFTDKKAFRIVAPLKNQSAAILAFNLNRGTEVQTSIKPSDYANASGMLQPYEGQWELPAEGILLYDYLDKKAVVLKEEYAFSLKTREEKLLQLSPIQKGWSVIGRPDKYLAASTFDLLEIKQETISIKMEENGPILLWSDSKTPASDSFEFTALGNGLWRGELVKPEAQRVYEIKSQ